MCPCGSCKKTSDLTLKFVAHVGEVATQTIRRRKSIVGLDVIHVHRLLKNPVEVPEYLLVSDELYRDGDAAASELAMQEIPLDLEGIGLVRSHFVDVGDLAAPVRALVAAAHRRHVRHGRPGNPLRHRVAAPTRRELSRLTATPLTKRPVPCAQSERKAAPFAPGTVVDLRGLAAQPAHEPGHERLVLSLKVRRRAHARRRAVRLRGWRPRGGWGR